MWKRNNPGRTTSHEPRFSVVRAQSLRALTLAVAFCAAGLLGALVMVAASHSISLFARACAAVL
ncbi:hypothetical protein ACJ4V0_16015 [Phreatobacter sp. HK31-P]